MNFDELKNTFKDNSRPILNDFFDFLDKLSLVANAKNNEVFFSDFQLPSNQDMNFIENSYDSFIPFLVESASGQYDIYCYDFEQEACPAVAVFSDHAVVNRWDSVPDFLSWLERMTNTGR